MAGRARRLAGTRRISNSSHWGRDMLRGFNRLLMEAVREHFCPQLALVPRSQRHGNCGSPPVIVGPTRSRRGLLRITFNPMECRAGLVRSLVALFSLSTAGIASHLRKFQEVVRFAVHCGEPFTKGVVVIGLPRDRLLRTVSDPSPGNTPANVI